jgi:hypothetical protein
MVLYHGPGATDYDIGAPVLSPEQWARVKANTCRFLRVSGATAAADLLENHPFRLVNATNGFGDEFTMLALEIPMEEYVDLAEWSHQPENRQIAWRVATGLREFGFVVRIIAVDRREDDTVQPVATPELRSPSATVEQALDDAQHLLASSGAASAVDRVHTALHGYLRDLSLAAGMNAAEASAATLQRLLSWLTANHPRLVNSASEETTRILRSFGGIAESLSHFRNNASLAHPNSTLLGETEAMLAINAVRTILHYVAEKLA